MENKFEKIPMEKCGDFSEKSEKKRGETIQEGIMDEIQNYIDFLNEVESRKELMLEWGFDFKKAEKIVENNLIDLMERIKDLAADGKFKLVIRSSIADIIGNSVVMDMGLVKKRILEEGIKEDKCKECLNRLRKSLDAILYYTKSVCDDDEKLEMELAEENGYIEKFKDYFFEGKVSEKDKMISKRMLPKGIKKIAYFRFFNEWEKGNIKQDSLEEELEKLDDSLINKEKVRSDFKK